MGIVEVEPVPAEDLAEPLRLLEEFARDGLPLPEPFVRELREAIETGDLEVLAAREGEDVVGVAVLAFRLNLSAAGRFASVEDLYVSPSARRRGVGRALLEAVQERCAARGVSYVEVQTDDEAADFYAALGYEREAGVVVLSRSYAL